MGHRIEWVDGKREPQCPPNPAYPKGIDIDLAGSAPKTCQLDLPYPAKRCGHYAIKCDACKQVVVVTTAGRPDDPRSLRLACKELPN